MKKLIAILIILTVIISFIIIHSILIINLTNDIVSLSNSAYTNAVDDNWEYALKDINEIESKWDSYQFWIYMTIDSNKIEELESALYQSEKFAQQEERPDFTDKITLFLNLVKQLPNQEGLSVKNLL